MHTLWKGSISFGMVNIPVKMYTSLHSKDVRFKYLHRECKTPVRMARMCETCKREVLWSEVVRGYEYTDGNFVLMEKEELSSLESSTNKTIEIVDFVELKEVDPIYFSKTYYLGSADENNKAYALLRKVLQESERIGIAFVTIRNKQSLAIVRVYDNTLVLETLYFPDEIRKSEEIPIVPSDVDLPEKELYMAQQLIDQLTTSFNPEGYTDEYRSKLEKAIEKKLNDEEVVTPKENQSENVLDLMAALKASLEDTKAKRKKSS